MVSTDLARAKKPTLLSKNVIKRTALKHCMENVPVEINLTIKTAESNKSNQFQGVSKWFLNCWLDFVWK